LVFPGAHISYDHGIFEKRSPWPVRRQFSGPIHQVLLKGAFVSGYSNLILNFLIDSHKNRFCLTEKQGDEYIDVDWDMVIVQFCCD
jgi:hypothetical protein